MAIEYTTWLSLVILGAAFGSFAAATVWRLRSKQLVEDAREGENVDQSEYERLLPLSTVTVSSDRSRCLQCGHPLTWYDLLPIVSWVMLRGRCRYCKAPIGFFEPLMEVGVAGAFFLSYIFWPQPLNGLSDIALFSAWLVAIVLLAILFAYDTKWFLLPDSIVFPLIGVGVVMSTLQVLTAPDSFAALISVGGGVLILSGLYYFLWYLSKGQWIGFGDVKLGLALALIVADWKMALVALLGANIIGCLIVVPGMVLGKLDRKAHVPFGPLLIAGAVLALLFGERLIDVYSKLAF